MNENEFMYRLMAGMRRMEEEESKPRKEKHYGFGLPKTYRIVDATTGTFVTVADYETAQRLVTETSESIPEHHFETRAMWM